MQISLNNLVSITDANQNFSKVARLVDEKGTAVILKNNVPKYVVLDYNILLEGSISEDEKVMEAANRLLSKYKTAFEELGK